jgi:hypothetical protein
MRAYPMRATPSSIPALRPMLGKSAARQFVLKACDASMTAASADAPVWVINNANTKQGTVCPLSALSIETVRRQQPVCSNGALRRQRIASATATVQKRSAAVT